MRELGLILSYANNDSISLGSLHFIFEEYGWITSFQSYVGDFRLLTTNGETKFGIGQHMNMPTF